MLVFEEDVINKYLQCPLCQIRYDEPRTMPCGKTVCNNCLKLMEVTKLNENLRQLKCKACNEMHILSKTELGTNEFVKVFLDDKMASKDIYRGKAAESFKHQLKEMKNDLDYFDASNRDKIRSHCEALRREIEKEANSLVEFIEVSSNGFLKQIDEYEEDCIAEYENKNAKPDEKLQGDFVRDIRDFYQEWVAYLKRLLIDDDEIIRATQMATTHQKNLQDQKKKLDAFIFNGNVLKYQKSGREPAVEDILGALVLNPINKQEPSAAPTPEPGPGKINLSNKLAANSTGFLDDQLDYDDIFKNMGGDLNDHESDEDDSATNQQTGNNPNTSQAAFMKELKEKIDKSKKSREADADETLDGVKIKIETNLDLNRRPSQIPQHQMHSETEWQAQMDELKFQQEQETKLKKNKEMQQRYLQEKQKQMQQPTAQPGMMEIYTEETTNITETETIIEKYRTNPSNRKENLKIDDVSVLLNAQSPGPAQPQPEDKPASPQQPLASATQFSRPPTYTEVPFQPNPQPTFGYQPQSNSNVNGFSRRQSKSLLMDTDNQNAKSIPAPLKSGNSVVKSKLPVLSSPNLTNPEQYQDEDPYPAELTNTSLNSSTSKMSSSPSKTNLNRRVLNLIRRKNKKSNHNDA